MRTAFAGIVWRILAAARADDPTGPARAPEGRFHHDGQVAVYTSLTAEGAGIAIQRYLGPKDAPRVILPLHVTAHFLMDLRLLPDPAAASVVWQDQRDQGLPAPTWAFSDAARAAGAQGLLYASRSRPDLTHLVLFDLAAQVLRPAGPAQDWPAG